MRAGRGIVRTCVAASGWWWRCIFDGVASTSYYCIVGIVAKDDPKIYRVATAACSSTCVEQRAAFDAICFASQMAKPSVFLCSLVNHEPSAHRSFATGLVVAKSQHTPFVKATSSEHKITSLWQGHFYAQEIIKRALLLLLKYHVLSFSCRLILTKTSQIILEVLE